MLLLLFLFRRYKINSIEIEKGSDLDKKITGERWFGKMIIMLCMLLFSFHAASDDTYIQFVATYLQYIPLGIKYKYLLKTLSEDAGEGYFKLKQWSGTRGCLKPNSYILLLYHKNTLVGESYYGN